MNKEVQGNVIPPSTSELPNNHHQNIPKKATNPHRQAVLRLPPGFNINIPYNNDI